VTTAGLRVEIRNQDLRKILCMSVTLCKGNAEVLQVTWPSSIPDGTVLRSVEVDQHCCKQLSRIAALRMVE
jgi:hypothetical protein